MTDGGLAPFGFLTAGQIRFGRGTALTCAGDVARFGRTVLLVRGQAVGAVDEIAARLDQRGCRVIPVIGQGEPTCASVGAAVDLGRAAQVDVVLAIGGGAVLDLGKAVAAMIPARGDIMDHLEGVGGGQPLNIDPLPCIAIPTTAGTGAEVTKNAVIGVPEAGRKVSLRDDRMLPRLAIVDPALTDGAPASVTFSSGFDAVTQVIEPYLSNRANPLTDTLCRSAIPMGVQALARLAEGEDAGARDHIAYVSLLGGLALANAGLGAVHGLAGVIGGRFDAPHGLICARLLGPILGRNRAAAEAAGDPSDRYGEIATALGQAFDVAPDAAFAALSDQLDALKLPRLGKWLAADTDLNALATEAAATSSMRANPYILSMSDLSSAVAEAL